MFKKILFCAVLAAVTAFTGACSSVKIATDLNDVKLTTDERYTSVGHVHADVWGVYALGLPLVSGSIRENNKCVFFDDTVTNHGVVQLLTGNAKAKLKATAVTDIATEATCVPFLIFISYKDIQASGNALR